MEIEIATVKEQIKSLLKDFSVVSANTSQNTDNRIELGYQDIPIDPNLMSYCFDNILGFDVEYRIAEKVNYIIDFDYKGTLATVGHFKLSYRLSVDKQYKDEVITVFRDIKPLLEQLFMLIGEQALINNEFSMVNEAPAYLSKLVFYQKKIERLVTRERTIREKLRGQYDIIESTKNYKCMRPKGADYLQTLESEITYDIESYVDTFFSALEHILTLLYPFVWETNPTKSYYKQYIRNTKWDWSTKIKDVCKDDMPDEIIEKLRKIKEVYRNHNAHGSFSREMMAYVQIPNFGRFPIYVGKNYLKGFLDNYSSSVSYNMYLSSKEVFDEFWRILDETLQIPMMFVRSGLPIPIDTRRYTDGVCSIDQAQWVIDRIQYELDNQANMDW